MIRQGHTLSWRLLAYGRVNHLMKDALLAAFLDHLACNPWPDRAARRINMHQYSSMRASNSVVPVRGWHNTKPGTYKSCQVLPGCTVSERS